MITAITKALQNVKGYEMIVNLMCDLETTGTEPGCCILSIALVPLATDYALDTFYETISHRLSLDAGFTDDEATLLWWDKQKPEIQEEAFSGIRSPYSVLESVSAYMANLGEPKEIHLWGNGKDFDNVILAHAFKKLGIKQPWHYRNNWCYRDLAKLYPMYPKGDVMAAHNALADATAQARHAEIIMAGASRGVPATFPRTI